MYGATRLPCSPHLQDGMLARFTSSRRKSRIRYHSLSQVEDERTGLLDKFEMVARSRSSQGSNPDPPQPPEMAGMNFEDLLDGLPEHERESGHRLRRHLQFFFMNPMDKWKVRRQFPWKLALQVAKILFVTIQLILFAELRMSHVDFMEDTTTVMRHKFLKDWDDDRDALEYPPSEGRYSVYDGKGIFEHFAFIINSYYSIQSESFASFSYDTSHPNGKPDALVAGISFDQIPFIEICLDQIANVTVHNNTYEFDIADVYQCHWLNLTKDEVEAIKNDSMEVVKALELRGITFRAEDALRLSKATMKIRLHTIHFSPVTSDQRPECYLIQLNIVFDNSRHTGQIHIMINNVISYENICNGRVIKGNFFAYDTIIMGILDIFVLVVSVSSFILCLRALIKAHLLKNRAADYFESSLKMPLSVSDRLDFLNLWYVMIVINDVCLVVGTIAKISIEFRDFDSDIFTMTGILLGMGALLVYAGVLRYFGFFNQYNILILTMKKAMPSMLRFMACAIVLYCGFWIAGWVIIGPYSMKFRTLAASSEALFSLLNGDDMFATFYTINDSNTTIKIFGTVYIYVFVSLFIYVVLSLFIAIIMDAYEVVKDRYSEGLHLERSHLKDFCRSCAVPDHLASPSTREAFSPGNLLNLGRFSSFVNPLDELNSPRPTPPHSEPQSPARDVNSFQLNSRNPGYSMV